MERVGRWIVSGTQCTLIIFDINESNSDSFVEHSAECSGVIKEISLFQSGIVASVIIPDSYPGLLTWSPTLIDFETIFGKKLSLSPVFSSFSKIGSFIQTMHESGIEVSEFLWIFSFIPQVLYSTLKLTVSESLLKEVLKSLVDCETYLSSLNQQNKLNRMFSNLRIRRPLEIKFINILLCFDLLIRNHEQRIYNFLESGIDRPELKTIIETSKKARSTQISSLYASQISDTSIHSEWIKALGIVII